MAITPTQMADLVRGTLRDLGRLRFQQIAQDLVHYECFSKWFKRDKVMFDSGIGIQRTLMTSYDDSAARHVDYLAKDEVSIPDVLSQLQVNWVHAQTVWSIIYQTDILMNSGPEKIVDVIKARRAAALLGLVEELEQKAWACPASGDTGTLPLGLQYWVVANSSTGFYGGAASGHTTVGNITPTADNGWKNYTFTFDDVVSGDAVKKMRTAHRNIRFVSPINIDDYRGGLGERYRIYTCESILSSFEDIASAQNESLGRDIASMDGTATFRRHPMIWIPHLDTFSTNYLYMIDHSTFNPCVLKGDYLRESEATNLPNQHNCYMSFVDLTYQFLCVDRRRNAVGYEV